VFTLNVPPIFFTKSEFLKKKNRNVVDMLPSCFVNAQGAHNHFGCL